MLSFEEYYQPNITLEDEHSSWDTKEGEDAIVHSHLKLVVSIASQYSSIQTSRITFEDLVQEGILGLYDALKKFDPSRGNRFSSFARPYIKNSIRKYLRNNSHFPTIPQKTLWKIFFLKRFIDSNPLATEEDMADAMDTEVKQIEDLLIIMECCKYHPIDGTSAYTGVIIEEESERSKALSKLVSELSSSEKEILNMRDIRGLSWREIGTELGLSHEAVRKRYHKIVDKLRESASSLSKGI